MRDKMMEELAGLYGLEINETEPGKGGLFYEDSQGNKMPLNDIFGLEDYIGVRKESISLKECGAYTSYDYVSINSPMLDAA